MLVKESIGCRGMDDGKILLMNTLPSRTIGNKAHGVAESLHEQGWEDVTADFYHCVPWKGPRERSSSAVEG